MRVRVRVASVSSAILAVCEGAGHLWAVGSGVRGKVEEEVKGRELRALEIASNFVSLIKSEF